MDIQSMEVRKKMNYINSEQFKQIQKQLPVEESRAIIKFIKEHTVEEFEALIKKLVVNKCIQRDYFNR